MNSMKFLYMHSLSYLKMDYSEVKFHFTSKFLFCPRLFLNTPILISAFLSKQQNTHLLLLPILERKKGWMMLQKHKTFHIKPIRSWS